MRVKAWVRTTAKRHGMTEKQLAVNLWGHGNQAPINAPDWINYGDGVWENGKEIGMVVCDGILDRAWESDESPVDIYIIDVR